MPSVQLGSGFTTGIIHLKVYHTFSNINVQSPKRIFILWNLCGTSLLTDKWISKHPLISTWSSHFGSWELPFSPIPRHQGGFRPAHSQERSCQGNSFTSRSDEVFANICAKSLQQFYFDPSTTKHPNHLIPNGIFRYLFSTTALSYLFEHGYSNITWHQERQWNSTSVQLDTCLAHSLEDLTKLRPYWSGASIKSFFFILTMNSLH